MDSAIDFIFQIAVLIFSVVIHELSHGLMANALGDPTAKYSGRLTINPVRHLDFFGSFLLPVFSYLAGGFIFGWAKPVPYNPYNLKSQKWGPALVGTAGPASNFLIAIVFGLLIRLLPLVQGSVGPIIFLNLLKIFSVIVFLNLILGVFNFLPIPPLDGSKLLFSLFPYQWHEIQRFLEEYGFIILIVFILSFSWVISFAASFLFHFIVGSSI